jgi:hypothetical protein
MSAGNNGFARFRLPRALIVDCCVGQIVERDGRQDHARQPFALTPAIKMHIYGLKNARRFGRAGGKCRNGAGALK